MENFRLLAHPWWVNLLLLVPLLAYFQFRCKRPELTSPQLLTSAIFALSFGLVEGAVAIYLGAAVGLLPGYAGTLSDVARLSADLDRQSQQLSNLPPSLLRVEVFREAATMLMLLSIAILAEQKRGERFAVFLWIFALWDIGYYAALWTMVRWPYSPTSPDVLFFIPVPWTSQVWFPILISILTTAVVLLTRHRGRMT
jgi:Kef-type K+ transport system membrane component KefB